MDTRLLVYPRAGETRDLRALASRVQAWATRAGLACTTRPRVPGSLEIHLPRAEAVEVRIALRMAWRAGYEVAIFL